jgi:hypothetical protein
MPWEWSRQSRFARDSEMDQASAHGASQFEMICSEHIQFAERQKDDHSGLNFFNSSDIKMSAVQ